MEQGDPIKTTTTNKQIIWKKIPLMQSVETEGKKNVFFSGFLFSSHVDNVPKSTINPIFTVFSIHVSKLNKVFSLT